MMWPWQEHSSYTCIKLTSRCCFVFQLSQINELGIVWQKSVHIFLTFLSVKCRSRNFKIPKCWFFRLKNANMKNRRIYNCSLWPIRANSVCIGTHMVMLLFYYRPSSKLKMGSQHFLTAAWTILSDPNNFYMDGACKIWSWDCRSQGKLVRAMVLCTSGQLMKGEKSLTPTDWLWISSLTVSIF